MKESCEKIFQNLSSETPEFFTTNDSKLQVRKESQIEEDKIPEKVTTPSSGVTGTGPGWE